MSASEISTVVHSHRWHVSANSIAASVFLAFLTTAGIFYINIMPAVVSGLKEGLGFTSQQAGFVSSANLYGASFGALLAVALVKRINWRLWSGVLMATIIGIDCWSIFITQPELMIGLRAVHGVVGGLLVGIGFAIISRTSDPDKTFGYLLFIQWGLGGLGLMFIPGLVPEFGSAVLFLSLVAFTAISLAMLFFLPDYSLPKKEALPKKEPIPKKEAVPDKETLPEKEQGRSVSNLPLLLLTLISIFLFQGANMGLFAYMIGIGTVEGLSLDFMSPALGSASWVALIGAFLVMLIGTKYGRVKPLIIGTVVTALCTWLLHYSEIAEVYLYGNILIGVGWAFVLPYLFGLCSELDKAGQYAAMGGFASKMGLATGPMVGALLLHNEVYAPLINVATVALVLSLFIALKPAKQLDQ